jgi:hypothetical protein
MTEDPMHDTRLAGVALAPLLAPGPAHVQSTRPEQCPFFTGAEVDSGFYRDGQPVPW